MEVVGVIIANIKNMILMRYLLMLVVSVQGLLID